MSDIFQEVNEDVRKDEILRLWRRWGPYIIGVAATIILGWTAFVLWRDQVETGLAQNSGDYEAALALVETDPDAAIEALERLGADAAPGYVALSRFSEAAIFLDKGEWQTAVGLYDQVAAESGLNPTLRDLANLMAGMAMADLSDGADVRARLEPLVADGGIWSHSAREIIALLDFRAGDLDAAESAFSDLSFSDEAPAGLRQRAQEMLELIDSARAAMAPILAAPVEYPVEDIEDNQKSDGEDVVAPKEDQK